MTLFRRIGPIITTALVFLAAASRGPGASPAAGLERFYIGTYTGPSSQGIYQSGLDLGAGTLGPRTLAATTPNPSFIALHPSHKFLYAVNESSSGAVVAFSINRATGGLTLLNQQSSGGSSPCQLVVDSAGKNVLVANYGSGSVTVLPIEADGRLGTATGFVQDTGSSIDPVRQTGPHAHCIALAAGDRFALVCDLGIDKVMCYRFDSSKGTLATNAVPWATVTPGAGPRHLAFEPQGRYAYVISELNSTITAFAFDAQSGALTAVQTVSTLPPSYTGANAAAEIVVHPSGKFLYGSNRGYNSIAVYALDGQSGTLTLIQQQPSALTPRNFAIEPTGAFCLVASQDSSNVLSYAINPQTGKLTPTGQSITVGTPVCVVPVITQAPQPVLTVQMMTSSAVQVNIGNALSALTYELDQAPALQPAMNWSLLATGAPGQTNFMLTNAFLQAFIRAAVVTNY